MVGCLDAVGRGLLLPQLIVPGFVDSPWEALLFLGSGWQVDGECPSVCCEYVSLMVDE